MHGVRREDHVELVISEGQFFDTADLEFDAVALAKPGGSVLTGDRVDIEALAAHHDRVSVNVI